MTGLIECSGCRCGYRDGAPARCWAAVHPL